MEQIIKNKLYNHVHELYFILSSMRLYEDRYHMHAMKEMEKLNHVLSINQVYDHWNDLFNFITGNEKITMAQEIAIRAVFSPDLKPFIYFTKEDLMLFFDIDNMLKYKEKSTIELNSYMFWSKICHDRTEFARHLNFLMFEMKQSHNQNVQEIIHLINKAHKLLQPYYLHIYTMKYLKEISLELNEDYLLEQYYENLGAFENKYLTLINYLKETPY